MRNSRLGLAGLVICLLLLCSGCFDVNEDITVRSDLSGKYVLKLSLPERLAAMGDMIPGEHSGGDPQRNFEELKSQLEQESFVESAVVSSATEGEMRFYTLEILARDMRKLGDYFAEQANANGESPYRLSFKLERKSFGTFHFSRDLQFSAMAGMGLPNGGGKADDASGTPDSSAGDDAAQSADAAGAPEDQSGERSIKDRLLDKGRDALSKGIDQGVDQGKKALGGLGGMLGGLMGQALMADHYYTVRLYAAGIESTDAVAAADGKSVEWRIPMAELMDGSASSRTLEADFKALGISGAALLLLTLLVMFLFAGLLVGIAVTSARRKRRAAQSPAPPAQS